MTTLGNAADMIVGFAFKSSGFLDSEADGLRLVRGDNVQRGYLRWGDKTKKWALAEVEGLDRYQLAEGDVLLAMDRPIVGDGLKMAWVTAADLPALLVQRVCRLRGKAGAARTGYLRYLLAAPEFAAHIHRITTGANIPHISGKDIAAYEFALPAINQQDAVIRCLAAYDDLIGTNQRRIVLLEQAAHLLYREWFVQLRFPGHGISPPRDGMPLGWQWLSLGEVCHAVGGGTPSTARPEYWNGEVVWVTPTDVTRNDCLTLLDSEKKISDLGLINSSAKLVPPDTILMTSRASIGFFALMDQPICTNQGFISVVPHQEHSRMFLLLNLMHRVEEMIGLATGSTFKELSKKTFRALPICWPTESVRSAFDERVYPLIRQVRLIKKQNSQLIRARDLLLPKLMSGQLDVCRMPLPEDASA